MQITLNGERHDVEAPLSVLSLLQELGLDVGRVAVEVNRCILKRKDFDAVELSQGDRIEVVTFVGGG